MQYTKRELAMLAPLALGWGIPTPAAAWSDNFIGYRYEPASREPRNRREIEKDIVQLTHVSTYRYGSNFLNLDHFHSDGNDRAKGSTTGAEEDYLTYRHQVEWGKVTGIPVKLGPLRDLAATVGFDLNQKNNAVGPRKRLFVAGPTLKFDVPGFLDVGLWYSREANHNSLGTAHQDVVFDPAWMIGAAWGIPFPLAGTAGKFQGFLNIIGPKGKDYNGRETAREVLLRTSVMVDAGWSLGLSKNTLWAGVGYEFWENKFGNQPVTGTRVNSPLAQLEWHF